MSISLPDYKVVETLYESERTVVVRARNESTGQVVILKSLSALHPSSKDLLHFRREYEIASSLEGDEFVTVLGIIKGRQSQTLIQEDFGAQSLSQTLEDRRFSIDEFLDLALDIAGAIAALHEQGVVHKDINPSNIVWNPDTGQTKLIDFGLSTRIEELHAARAAPTSTIGTLPYISPEQTGRTNRLIDYRTDFYSLGVTFYELLTGHLPFEARESTEIIHAHLARRPPPMQTWRGDIPHQISRVVLKLMAKEADDRYQSMRGLIADLQECRRQYEDTGSIAAFEPGQEDIRAALYVPRSLYGRTQELEHLHQTYRRVCSGDRHLTLITGPPGVGKSTLVEQLQIPVIDSGGWFVSAKFESSHSTAPYRPLARAVGTLVSKILSRSDKELSRWRCRIEDALGDDTNLVLSVIPELRLVLGDHRDSDEHRPDLAEAQSRFRSAFRRLLAVFCDASHPLTIVVDDLQWADDASLELMKILLTDEHLDHFWIVGTFRDQDVDDDHRLSKFIDDLVEGGESVESIELGPLDSQDLRQIIADSLSHQPREVAGLADLVAEKTSGNPYFVRQFLEMLHDEQLLYFDGQTRSWRWDEHQINALPVTDNVVDMIFERIERLDDDTKTALQYASLLGSSFLLKTLATVCEVEVPELYRLLEPAIELGVIIPLSELELSDPDDPESAVISPEMLFAHDRVQEAAARLLDEEQRPAAHLRVGRLLKQRLEAQAPVDVDMLFVVVDNLNAAIELIEDEGERRRLIELNLRAARAALDAQAVAEAAIRLRQTSELFADDAWSADTELTRQVYYLWARAESLQGDFDKAQHLAEVALEHLSDPVERADFEILLITQATLDFEVERAIDIGETALADLGIELPRTDLEEAVRTQLAALDDRLGDRDMAYITDIEVVDDRRARAALQVLSALQPTAGLYDQRLFMVIGLQATDLTLDIGVHPESVTGLAVYGMALCLSHRPKRGYEVGALVLELVRGYGGQASRSQVAFIFAAMILPWSHPLRESIAIFDEGYRAGMRSGNYLFAGFNLFLKGMHQLGGGEALARVLETATESLHQSQKLRHAAGVALSRSLRLVVRNLLGQTASATAFDDEEVESATAFLSDHIEESNRTAPVNFSLGCGQALYFHERPELALEKLESIEDRLGPLVGTLGTGRHPFYHALALSEVAMSKPPSKRQDDLDKLDELRATLARLADQSPANFTEKLHLVDAELARLRGDIGSAMNNYDDAIDGARRQDFLHIEALANERAGLFWLEYNKPDFAAPYLREARDSYRLWGAAKKVELLDRRHGRLVTGAGDKETTSGSSSSSGADSIDLESVFQASELIASHIDLDALLPTLMDVTVKNAGAEHGTFLVIEDDQLCVAVEGQVEEEPVRHKPVLPIQEWSGGAHSVVRYVHRTGEPLVLGRAHRDPRFLSDPYLQEVRARSVLCIPAEEHGRMRGILYVENNLADEVFTEDRIQVLQILAGHIAIALNKARLYGELTEKKERFRQLAENIQEVFWLMDWPSRQIVYVSPAYETVWGRPTPSTPLSVNDWVQSIIEDDRQQVAAALRQQTLEGEYDKTYRIERASGDQRWIRDRGFPITDGDGRVHRIAGVARDITGEHEVAKMKDEFISVVSHELRTPLTPITGVFSMLLNEYDDELPEEVQQMARLGLRNSRRLLRLIDDLLDIQKLSMDDIEFHFEYVDARELVEEAVELNQPLGKTRQVAFCFDPPERPHVINIDRNRLLQVMTNLLANAAKFSDRGDTIDVDIDRVDDQVRLAVTDHGPGIPSEVRTRIFEKFTQADSSLTRKHGGVGLGLAIAHSLVKRLGGTIDFDTELGSGTTFYVEFPAVDQKSN